MIDEITIIEFQFLLLNWYKENMRHFPWRYTFDPYKVLISEILLQQTNVYQIVNSYNQLIDKYKTLLDLSNGDINFINSIFSNLGLHYRSERLLNIAKSIVEYHNGIIPVENDILLNIKGIGHYTAGAILCFGYNKPAPILDRNVIRIFKRIFGAESGKSKPHEDPQLLDFTSSLLPESDYVDYNYALLDFGAKVCTARNPSCSSCPLNSLCDFYK